MRYDVSFAIDHGVSHGMGSKYHERSTIIWPFEGATQNDIIEAVQSYANHLTGEYLSNPDTGFVSVGIAAIVDATGKNIIEPRDTREALLEDRVIARDSPLRRMLLSQDHAA